MKKVWIIISIITLFAACKKQEIPKPSITDPVFTAEANINGQPISLTPGIDGMYMYTEHSELGEGNVTLTSGIAPENCPNCGPAIWVEWNSNTPEGMGESFDPAIHFVEGVYPFQTAGGPSNISYFINDFDDFSNSGGSLLFNGNPVVDQGGLIDSNPNLPFVIDYNLIDEDAGLIQGSMFLSPQFFPELCGESLLNIDGFGVELQNDLTTVLVTPPFFIPEDETVVWTMAGEIVLVSQGSDPVLLELINPVGTEIELVVQGDGGGGMPLLAANITLFILEAGASFESFEIGLEAIPMLQAADPDVYIYFIDENGEHFVSSACELPEPQPQSSFFEIAQITDYQDNPDGVFTQIAKLNLDVMLFSPEDPDASPIHLELDGAELGFAVGD